MYGIQKKFGIARMFITGPSIGDADTPPHGSVTG